MRYVLKNQIFILLGIVLLSTSCSKKEEEPKPKTTQEKIQGKWSFVKSTTRGYDSNGNQTSIDEYTGKSEDYFEFNSNGTVVSLTDGTLESFNYTLLNETSIQLTFTDSSGTENTTWIIKELTDNKFLLESTESFDSGNRYVTEIELKK